LRCGKPGENQSKSFRMIGANSHRPSGNEEFFQPFVPERPDHFVARL